MKAMECHDWFDALAISAEVEMLVCLIYTREELPNALEPPEHPWTNPQKEKGNYWHYDCSDNLHYWENKAMNCLYNESNSIYNWGKWGELIIFLLRLHIKFPSGLTKIFGNFLSRLLQSSFSVCNMFRSMIQINFVWDILYNVDLMCHWCIILWGIELIAFSLLMNRWVPKNPTQQYSWLHVSYWKWNQKRQFM